MFDNILSWPAPGDAPLLPHLCAKTVHLRVPPDTQTAVTELLRAELSLAVPSGQRVAEEEKHVLLQRARAPDRGL